MSEADCIQVAVRIRPLVESELTRKCGLVVDKAGSGQQIVCEHSGGKSVYSFNYVFNQLDTQESIYEACVKKMLDKLFQGYNATILAYGQTGSGKTHTMGTTFGGQFDEHMGLIPRAVIDIFKMLENVGANHNTITCSFLELYQEQLFDLLSGKSREQSILDIRECTTKGIVVPGLTETVVKNPEETLDCLMKGSNGRMTGATAMNLVSSRSHAIFTITLKFVCDDKVIKSKFHLVDLAGSERSNKTKAIGDRFKEGVQINKGLLALSKVIAALEKSNNGGYVGYRDSKLTRLLQDSLGGNSVTLMIACVSPADYNTEETLSTLRYADQAKKIKNKPIINLDSDSVKLNKIKQTVYALELKLHELKNVKMREGGTDEARLRKEIDEMNARNIFIEKNTQEMLDCLVSKHDKTSSFHNTFKQMKSKIEFLKTTVTEMIANYGDGDVPYKLEIDSISRMVQQMGSVLAEYESNDQQMNLDIEIIAEFGITNLTEDEIVEEDKITEKQLDYRNQIRDINTKIELKFQLIKKINEQKILEMSAASNASSNNDSQSSQVSLNNMTFNTSAEGLIKGYEIRIKHLETQKRELAEKMKTKNKFNGEEYRIKLKEMDTEIKELRQSTLTQSKNLKMKEKDPKKIKSLEMEINELRRTKQRLNVCMQSELKRFDTWKAEKNTELLKEEIRYKKTQEEVEKCNVKFVSEHYELRRQIEEANERKNRLKSVLDNINKNKHNTNISDFIENAMNLLLTSQDTKTSLNELMTTRTNLYIKLAYLKSQASPNKREIANLEEDLELRNAQINDLREKVLSLNVDEQLAKICDRIQTMADGKIVMKHCIDLAIDLKKKLSNIIVRYEDATRDEKKIKLMMELLEHENESLEQENTLKLKDMQMKYDDKITVLLRELNDQQNLEQSFASTPHNDLLDDIETIRENILLKQERRNALLEQINDLKNHSRITRNSIHLIEDEDDDSANSSHIIPETPYPPKIVRRKNQTKSGSKCGCQMGCNTNRCSCRRSNSTCVNCTCTNCYNKDEVSKENDSASANVPSFLIEQEADSTVETTLKRVSADDNMDKTPTKLQKLDNNTNDVVSPTYPYLRKKRQPFY